MERENGPHLPPDQRSSAHHARVLWLFGHRSESRLYRYSKRAYAIIDKKGTVRYKKVLDSPKELVTDDELLAELDKLPK